MLRLDELVFNTYKKSIYDYFSIYLVGDLNHPQLAAPIAIVTVVLITINIIVAIIIVLMWHKKGMSYKVTVIAMVISKVLGRDSTDDIETTVYGVSTDGIETRPNEVYGVCTDGNETTPNEVYGVGTYGIETALNEVYGVGTDGIETTPYEVYGVSTHPLQGHIYEDVKPLQGSSTP